MKPIALQLYTVREAAAKDFPATLRRVAEIGYKGVETAGYHGYEPGEVARMVKDLGMEIPSCHAALPTPENANQVVEDLTALGSKRVIGGFGPDQLRTVLMCKQAAETVSRGAELLKPHGLTCGMHNHWWEFHTVDGRLVYDILMQEAPDMFSELDVYWCAYGKADPVVVTGRYKSRIPLLHVKDGSLAENAPHLAVGSGVLDIPAIIAAADPNVLQWLVVELDDYAGDMWEAVEESYRYLVQNGLGEGNR